MGLAGRSFAAINSPSPRDLPSGCSPLEQSFSNLNDRYKRCLLPVLPDSGHLAILAWFNSSDYRVPRYDALRRNAMHGRSASRRKHNSLRRNKFRFRDAERVRQCVPTQSVGTRLS